MLSGGTGTSDLQGCGHVLHPGPAGAGSEGPVQGHVIDNCGNLSSLCKDGLPQFRQGSPELGGLVIPKGYKVSRRHG